MSGPIVKLTEIRDDDGELVAKMCCICFEFIGIGDLYVDEDGQKWDVCWDCHRYEQNQITKGGNT